MYIQPNIANQLEKFKLNLTRKFDVKLVLVLPQCYCRRTAAAQPPCCRRTAAALPPHCRRTAAVLPLHCRRTAAALPPYCRRTAAETLMYDRFILILIYSVSVAPNFSILSNYHLSTVNVIHVQ